MQIVNTSVSSGGLVGETIQDQHHGVNLLFHNDEVDADSDFRDVVDAVGAQTIRYPGGTITEEYFDLANPNAPIQTNVIDEMHGAVTVRSRDVLTLTEYLNFIAETDSTPVICLPTYRYFDLATGQIVPTAEAEIKTFIRELLTDQYGQADNVSIEIGNEFYQSKFQWTDAQFAQLQGQIAEWIHQEAKDLGLRDEIDIFAQAGRNYADNAMMASHFSGDNSDFLDGVVSHFYGTNSSGNTLGIGGGIGDRLDDINAVWGATLGPDFLLAVTEWNVGESGEETTLINGIMRSAPLLRIYAEMIEAGVDIATIWSAQSNSPASLSNREGQGSDLTPTGLFLSMLAESTEGKRMVDPTGNFRLETASGADLGYTYSFEGDQSSVTYYVSGVDQRIDLTADLTRYYAEGATVYVRVLGAEAGETGTEFRSDAEIFHVPDLVPVGDASGWALDLTLEPYEMIEVHVLEPGVPLPFLTPEEITEDVQNGTYTGTDADDQIYAAQGDDLVDGGGGNDAIGGGDGEDMLFGQTGDDVLRGDAGNDALYGGRGMDVLWGGAGNDILRGNRDNDDLRGGNGIDNLYGGHGHDTLFGDKDKDYLLGENGNDRLDGGTGNDNLTGGGGADIFVYRNSDYGYDRVKDFEIGIDKIDVTHFGFSSFSQVQDLASDTDFGLRIDFGGGNVLMLEGLTEAELSASDVLI